ncbi:TetR/AcrR family transcriptional regulator [Anaerocolumna sp. AGMB13025]|uniref:TetR/AcrR family transcriptional regulator n=1 Tax=Anaerocolumna sp. AGMB13025 TaxID=3039116 RepID=UPI00241F22D6|nr:TetR/AcrR family transcriptional regulator [Anaerocolumna sp. AGMB13025]WFR59255.1 TetR/AcrR family transcriptional regulator [Anaerocolumna sp. AGMB13025]
MKQSKRQLQKESTRKLILQAAYKVYANEGFGATTTSIAKEAQIAHGSIFAHFPTVEDLKRNLLEQFGTDMNRQLHELSENDSSLEEFLYAHIEILTKHQKFYRRLIGESSQLPEQVKYIYLSIQSTVSFHMSKVLEVSIKEGTLKKIPIHFIFNTWLGLLHYYLLNQELFAPEGKVLNRYKEELVRNFLELLAV